MEMTLFGTKLGPKFNKNIAINIDGFKHQQDFICRCKIKK